MLFQWLPCRSRDPWTWLEKRQCLHFIVTDLLEVRIGPPAVSAEIHHIFIIGCRASVHIDDRPSRSKKGHLPATTEAQCHVFDSGIELCQALHSKRATLPRHLPAVSGRSPTRYCSRKGRRSCPWAKYLCTALTELCGELKNDPCGFRNCTSGTRNWEMYPTLVQLLQCNLRISIAVHNPICHDNRLLSSHRLCQSSDGGFGGLQPLRRVRILLLRTSLDQCAHCLDGLHPLIVTSRHLWSGENAATKPRMLSRRTSLPHE